MIPSISTTTVCFIACHGGPADHFATYAEALTKEGYTVQTCASGPGLKKLEDRKITVTFPFALENLKEKEEDALADQIAKKCSEASVVITDVGHPFDIKLQRALAAHAPRVARWAYYDNPEPFVPGGYSATAANVMLAAQGVLFANENLAKAAIYSAPGRVVDLGDRRRIGIGYYPIDKAEEIGKKRALEHDKMRAEILAKNGVAGRGQVLVYFGGNNEEYFSRAFPAFLSLLAQVGAQTDLSNVLVILQQHPGAKAGNRDGREVTKWSETCEKLRGLPRIIVSDFSSDEAQVIADGAFYYQTSMGPQFILARIPTVQVGHEVYEDALVKSRLVSAVTRPDQLRQAIEGLEKLGKDQSQRDVVLRGLGIREDWLKVLKDAIRG